MVYAYAIVFDTDKYTVNAHSDTARNSLSLFHKQADISPGWVKGTSKETLPEPHQAVWFHYLAVQVRYSVMFLNSLF